MAAAHERAVVARSELVDQLEGLSKDTDRLPNSDTQTYDLEALAAMVERTQADLETAHLAVRERAQALLHASIREENAKRIADEARREDSRRRRDEEQRGLDEFSQRRYR
jgi:flagellar biosynthesis chaperone FliJ